jgi:hypothetical protein
LAQPDANQAAAAGAEQQPAGDRATTQAPSADNATPRDQYPAASDKRSASIAKKLSIDPVTIFGINKDGTVIVTEDGRKVSVPA